MSEVAPEERWSRYKAMGVGKRELCANLESPHSYNVEVPLPQEQVGRSLAQIIRSYSPDRRECAALLRQYLKEPAWTRREVVRACLELDVPLYEVFP